jgi:hypothetical protein
MSELKFDAASICTRLGLGDNFRPWLEELESIEPGLSPVRLPDPHDNSAIDALFARLCITPADAAEIIDHWPAPDQNPELWWLLEHAHWQLITQMNLPPGSPYREWEPLPASLGAIGRLFYIYVFLATVPAIRQWHQGRGISDAVSWATLADFGEHIALHRRIFGSSGLDSTNWMTLHFRGTLFSLGRLQFGRWQFPSYGPRPGTLALDVHIPESGGPLEPTACADSFARAREFFACHFPDEPYTLARCDSWLLDPQLAEYLPATSNIIRFQRLFNLVPPDGAGNEQHDQEVIRFVFSRVPPLPPLDDLPQRTTLERAVVQHLRAGRHWQLREGWMTLRGDL